jgi:DNA topoisomerase-2
VLARRSRADIVAELKTKKFLAILANQETNATNTVPTDQEDDHQALFESYSRDDGFAYLLDMKLTSLTKERVEELTRSLASKEACLESLKATTPEQLWLADLAALRPALEAFLLKDNATPPKKDKTSSHKLLFSKPVKRKASSK